MKITLWSGESLNVNASIFKIFFFEKFIVFLRRAWRSNSTIKYYLEYLARFISFSGIQDIQGFTEHSSFEDAYDTIFLRQNANSTKKKYRDALMRYYEFLIKKGKIKRNFASEMESVKCDYTEPMYLDQSAIDKVRGTLAKSNQTRFLKKRNSALFEIFLHTWLRRSEVINLKKTDVIIEKYGDQEKSKIFVKSGKWKKDRYVVISNDFSKYLLRWSTQQKKNEEFIFCSTIWLPLSKNAINLFFQRLSKRSGVHVHAHMLRHTYAMEVINRGISQKILQEQLGHSKLSTTDKYTRWNNPYIHSEINEKFHI